MGVMMNNMVNGMRRYVAGFAFRGDKVLLVRKNRPKWQAGFLNGIGGEMTLGESPAEAMRREFYEETGGHFLDWQLFASEEGPGYEVWFYRMSILAEHPWNAPEWNDVGEELYWVEPNTKEPVIGNLNWLLPLARDPREIVVLAKTMSDIREIRTW